MSKTIRKRFLIAFVFFAITAVARFLMPYSASVLFPGYRNVSKVLMHILSIISSILPVCIWDISLPFIFLALLITLINVFRKKGSFLKWLATVVMIVAILLCEVVCGWMLNHYAPPLANDLRLQVGQYSKEELYEAAAWYFDQAEFYAEEMTRDENGTAITPSFRKAAVIAGKSYASLEAEYPVFKGSHMPVKMELLAGDLHLYNDVTGMFMPITGESGVPYHDPPVPLLFTMCHEASHRLGLASEQEANFAAFLACIHNDEGSFRYSGYYMAFTYCYNSLFTADIELARTLTRNDSIVFKDKRDTRSIYDRYDSPMAEVSNKINDTYLKSFDQKDGIQSYGMVTDYLIAWYMQNIRPHL